MYYFVYNASASFCFQLTLSVSSVPEGLIVQDAESPDSYILFRLKYVASKGMGCKQRNSLQYSMSCLSCTNLGCRANKSRDNLAGCTYWVHIHTLSFHSDNLPWQCLYNSNTACKVLEIRQLLIQAGTSGSTC